ncbi:MAG: hypothetical protein HY270_24625 [Deltaproteobacteria bacterium]|nr:hypothetical protein [Deltaproteobacteria bacterium]
MSRIRSRRPEIVFSTVVLSVLAWLGGCRTDPNSARGVAEKFVDAHYVRIDLPEAKGIVSGLALHKLEDEQHLTAGQIIDETTRMPTVRYRLLEEKSDADTASFVFEGTIQVEDAGQFTRRWIVTTRHSDNAWRVSNFEEFD